MQPVHNCTVFILRKFCSVVHPKQTARQNDASLPGFIHAHGKQTLNNAVSENINPFHSEPLPPTQRKTKSKQANQTTTHARFQKGEGGGGGQGSGPTLKNHKNIGLLSNTGPDPLKNQKATNQKFNVEPSPARQRNAI